MTEEYAMELWDLFDKDGNPTGDTMVRGTPVPPERYHQVIHICIFNPDGKMLIQHRQPFKPTWSGMWDVSVGGAVAAGESVRIAAEREAAEELGYLLDLTDEAPAMRITFPDGFDNFYIVERDLDLNQFLIRHDKQTQRVEQFREALTQSQAALAEADLIVDSALCAGVTPAKHEAALETMRSCQVDVR